MDTSVEDRLSSEDRAEALRSRVEPRPSRLAQPAEADAKHAQRELRGREEHDRSRTREPVKSEPPEAKRTEHEHHERAARAEPKHAQRESKYEQHRAQRDAEKAREQRSKESGRHREADREEPSRHRESERARRHTSPSRRHNVARCADLHFFIGPHPVTQYQVYTPFAADRTTC